MGAQRGGVRRSARRFCLAASALLFICSAMAPLTLASGRPDLQRHARPVRSVFHIAKSENRNQVHYGVKVDAQCRPTGGQPIYGYWRDFEEGPRVTSPLLSHEQSAYGVTRPRNIERGEEGGRVLFGLRGFPDRSITMQTFKHEGGCRAWAVSPIKQQPALLRSIYVELGFLYPRSSRTGPASTACVRSRSRRTR
jgi:hypothetical protein